jgi:hypothetical protein
MPCLAMIRSTDCCRARRPSPDDPPILAEKCQLEDGWVVSTEWAERAAAFLKHKLRECEVTYAELAKRLKRHGLKEIEASVANKLALGMFPATFFLAVLAALELDGVALEEI